MTASFFVGGNIGALGKGAKVLAKAAKLSEQGQAIAAGALAKAPLAFWQTMGNYERTMAETYARLQSDEELRRALPAATIGNLTTGFLEYAGEYLPVGYANKAIGKAQQAMGQAVVGGSRRAALRAGANLMGWQFMATSLAESVQETTQNLAQVPLQGIVDAVVDYEARHGSLKGFDAGRDVPWERLAEEAGRTVMPSIVTSVALTGMTQGVAGIRLTGDTIMKVATIRQWRAAENAAQEAAAFMRGKREADNVHLPAYRRTIADEVARRTEAVRKEKGRELTGEELAAIQETVRDDVAVEDLRQVYNRYTTAGDAQAKDNVLNALGLSEAEKTRLVDWFDVIFAARRGAQFGAQVAGTAASVRAAMGAVGLEAEVTEGENGNVLVRFDDGNETEIRFVQRVNASVADGQTAPDGMFVRGENGAEVNVAGPVRSVIEIQEQSQGGSTFLLGHELAHNLLEVLRSTGKLTEEMERTLAQRFTGKDGAFDEEAFADAFGTDLRNRFAEQEQARATEGLGRSAVGRVLRRLADTVYAWAQMLTAWRSVAEASAPTGVDVHSVLEAFLARQGNVLETLTSSEGNVSENPTRSEGSMSENPTDSEGNRSENPNSSTEVKYHIPVQKAVVDAMEGFVSGETSVTLHNAEYGAIEYPLGKMGKGGKGLLHIVERRMEEGHTLDEAIEIAIRVAESAERGNLSRERYNTKHFDKDGVRAIVAFTDKGNPIITGYEISAVEGKGSYPDAPSPSAPLPHARSEEVVAALKEKIAQLRSEEQPKFHVPDATAPRFSETFEGKRMAAEVLDALMLASPEMVFDKARATEAFQKTQRYTERRKEVGTREGFAAEVTANAERAAEDADARSETGRLETDFSRGKTPREVKALERLGDLQRSLTPE